LALASQLAAGKSSTPSLSIMGSSGVKAKRPSPMATASDTSPASAIGQGLADAGANPFLICSAISALRT
jgi:hypothetical protein